MDIISFSTSIRLTALLLIFAASTGMAQSFPEGVFYTLPKSDFTLSGTVKISTYTPGPLAGFAKKYLGIQAKEQAESTHQIVQSRLTLSLMPDTSCAFKIPAAMLNTNQFSFGQGGILLTMNAPLHEPKSNKNSNQKWNSSSLGLSELPLLPLLSLTQETDTIYRREVLADSVVVEHWEIQTLIQQQTSEEIAKNTAQKLVQLDQDRQQLIRFNEDVQYSGTALNVMLKRLDSLEQYYHSLFQGRQISKSSTFSLPFSLSASDVTELNSKGMLKKILGGFSSNSGFSVDSTEAIPIVLSLQCAGIPNALHKFNPEKSSKISEGLVVRIPDRCTLQITLGNTQLVRENLPVFQAGKLIQLPNLKSGKLEYSVWSEISNPDLTDW